MVKGLANQLHLRPPLGRSLALAHARARAQTTAERSDTPSLSYLHLQLGGAVLLEHRIGQLLQKRILRAHQLPRERRRPIDTSARQSLWRAWRSGRGPKAASTPRILAPARRAPFTERRLRQARIELLRFAPSRVCPHSTSYLPDPPSDCLDTPGGQSQRRGKTKSLPGVELCPRPGKQLKKKRQERARRTPIGGGGRQPQRAATSIGSECGYPAHRPSARQHGRARKARPLKHSRGEARREAGLLTPTKMVAAFRPGSWSCGRNTDIPVAGPTAARVVRALLSNCAAASPGAPAGVRDPLWAGFREAAPS